MSDRIDFDISTKEKLLSLFNAVANISEEDLSDKEVLDIVIDIINTGRDGADVISVERSFAELIEDEGVLRVKRE